jgi:hypothetical protein
MGPVRAVGKLVGQWSKGRMFEPGFPARLVPHSAVYAASALLMELPQNFHGQSALEVRNDIHKLKKNLAA